MAASLPFLPTSSSKLDEDFADFERRASQVQQLVSALKEGKIDPKDVKIPGEKTEEEKKREADLAAKRQAERERKEAQRKAEEMTRWWERAELMRGFTREKAFRNGMELLHELALSGECSKDVSSCEGEDVKVIKDDDENVVFPKPKAEGKDVLDYSVWDKWIPDDPVSLQEISRLQKEQREKENRAFEEANAEFCDQFKEDMANRKRSEKKKEASGEELVQKGNKAFRHRRYDQALSSYEAALKSIPWNCKALRNIAQVYLMQERFEDALEYSERAVYLEQSNAKNLWRRSRALEHLGRLSEAVSSLEFALKVEPDNTDIAKQLTLLKSDLKDDEALDRLECKTGAPGSAEEGALHGHPDEVLKTLQENVFPRLLNVDNIDKNDLMQTRQDLALILGAMIQHDDATVLVRSAGVLERLCEWATADSTSSFHSVRCEVAPILLLATLNKRNTVVLQRRKLFSFIFNKFEEKDTDSIDADYAAAIVKNTFCEDWVLKNVSKRFLQGVIDALQRDAEKAAQILSELAIREKTRRLVATLTVETELLSPLLNIVRNHPQRLRAAEYCASAVANFSLSSSFQEAAALLAPTITDVFCGIIASETNGLSQLKGDALAALVNTSACKTDEVLELVANDGRTKVLFVMLDDVVAKRRQNEVHTSRGVRLLARCFTKADFAGSVVQDESAVRTVFRFVASVQEDLDLFRPMLAVVATCISSDFGMKNVSSVESALVQTLPKVIGGKDDILCANLLQCFIRLVTDSKRSQSKEYRGKRSPVCYTNASERPRWPCSQKCRNTPSQTSKGLP